MNLALPRGVTTHFRHPFTPMAGCGAPRACANRHSTAVANEQDYELMCLLAVLLQGVWESTLWRPLGLYGRPSTAFCYVSEVAIES